MGEVRTSISEQLHRLLKEEAARKGMPIKTLLAKIIEEHVSIERRRPL